MRGVLQLLPALCCWVSFCSDTSLLWRAVLGGNLGGVTSQLLALDGGQLAESLRLDTLTPVSRGGAQGGPYKRCVDGTFGYGEFVGWSDWQQL